MKIHDCGWIPDLVRFVASRERPKIPAPFNQLENRCVVKNHAADFGRTACVSRKGRCDHHRNAESEQNLTVHLVGIDVVRCYGSRRRDMFEESTPFIESDDKDGVLPFRAGRERAENRREKRVTIADIGMGMVIIPGSIVKNSEGRIDE
jgi:hypothetical protein